MREVDLLIIGGGPAGMAAAVEAKKNGVENLLVLERDGELGGILGQCIHPGFGLHSFGEELTGPEYAGRYVRNVKESDIPVMLNSPVLHISKQKVVTCLSQKEGLVSVKAKAIILATGCRERPRGAIFTPGDRCAGIYSAGLAQKMMNIHGLMPGKKVVIVGSGDIGLIMARRVTLEGGKVEGVVEIMPYSTGLARNIKQCLDDFSIPLHLSHTITEIRGKDRVEGVSVCKVDEKLQPIPGTSFELECDTVLFSVGLIPQVGLLEEMNLEKDHVTGGVKVDEDMCAGEGVFCCGNCLHVHDLVDNVSKEGQRAGKSAALYLKDSIINKESVAIMPQGGIKYVVPQRLDPSKESHLIKFRSGSVVYDCRVFLESGGRRLWEKKYKVLTPGEMQVVECKAVIPREGCVTLGMEKD